MADQKLTERVEVTDSNSLDLIHIVRHNDSYKMKASLISGSNQSEQITGNYTLGGVVHRQDLKYTVWVNECSINGIFYNTYVTSTVTLSQGNATNPRFDRFVVTVDDSGVLTLSAIEGVPAENPLLPNLNGVTQAEISFRLTAANETADTTTTSDLIYDENTGTPNEWNNTTLTTGGNLNYNTDPYNGTKSFNTPATFYDSVSWTKASKERFNGNDNLVFALKGILNTNSIIQIKLINSSSQNYYLRTIRYSGLSSYGFDVSLSTWQLVQIQLSDFAPNNPNLIEYDRIEFKFYSTPVLDMDWIQIQGGLSQPKRNPVTDILQKTRITLTSAQIRAIGTTPIVVIPAQGVNTVIKVISVVAKLNYYFSAYANNDLKITSGSLTLSSISSFLNNTSNIVKSGTLDGIELSENTEVKLDGIDSATGLGTVDVYITYEVVMLSNSNPINM